MVQAAARFFSQGVLASTQLSFLLLSQGDYLVFSQMESLLHLFVLLSQLLLLLFKNLLLLVKILLETLLQLVLEILEELLNGLF